MSTHDSEYIRQYKENELEHWACSEEEARAGLEKMEADLRKYKANELSHREYLEEVPPTIDDPVHIEMYKNWRATLEEHLMSRPMGAWPEPRPIRQAENTNHLGLSATQKAKIGFLNDCYQAQAEITSYAPDRPKFGKMWELYGARQIKLTFYMNNHILQLRPGCDWVLIKNRWASLSFIDGVVGLLFSGAERHLDSEISRILTLDEPRIVT